MADDYLQNEQQQFIGKLQRNSESMAEAAFVTSTGGGIAGFVAKVVGKYDFNHYNVSLVELGPPGMYPTEAGNEIIAINVAEPFLSQGSLTAGTYVIIFRIAGFYIFSRPL